MLEHIIFSCKFGVAVYTYWVYFLPAIFLMSREITPVVDSRCTDRTWPRISNRHGNSSDQSFCNQMKKVVGVRLLYSIEI